jgi:hypothetical protein
MNQITFHKSRVNIVSNTIPRSHSNLRPCRFPFNLEVQPQKDNQNNVDVAICVCLETVRSVSKEHSPQFKTSTSFTFPNEYNREQTISILYHLLKLAIDDFNNAIAKIDSTVLIDAAGNAVECPVPVFEECREKLIKALDGAGQN